MQESTRGRNSLYRRHASSESQTMFISVHLNVHHWKSPLLSDDRHKAVPFIPNLTEYQLLLMNATGSFHSSLQIKVPSPLQYLLAGVESIEPSGVWEQKHVPLLRNFSCWEFVVFEIDGNCVITRIFMLSAYPRYRSCIFFELPINRVHLQCILISEVV